SLFQISKCFRNSEQSGRIHNNEFSMLEWYGVDRNYRDNIDLTAELFSFLAPLACEENRHFFTEPFLVITMEEAFLRYARFSLEGASDVPSLRRELEKAGIAHDRDDSWEALYNRVFLTLVEPSLPKERTVVLTDYPTLVPTLARRKGNTPWCERWEMYIKGIELSNCYTEETDRNKVASYYALEQKEKARALVPHRVDEEYPRFFHGDYPPVSGNAMGLDRLLMALSGAERIGEVLLFS
ncbi:MAG: hypothetical protein PQJ60_12765, partial [Spirochaetales bacterium]|nr:hypothetical protein [Spirochaetales bacterium]